MIVLARTPGRACREEQYKRRRELLGVVRLPWVTPYPLGLASRNMLAASAVALDQALHSGRPEVVSSASRCHDNLLEDCGVIPEMCSGFYEAKEIAFKKLFESNCELCSVAEGFFKESKEFSASLPFVSMSQVKLKL
jgi:hypothetical protein